MPGGNGAWLSWKCWSQNFCPVGKFSKECVCVQHLSWESLKSRLLTIGQHQHK